MVSVGSPPLGGVGAGMLTQLGKVGGAMAEDEPEYSDEGGASTTSKSSEADLRSNTVS